MKLPVISILMMFFFAIHVPAQTGLLQGKIFSAEENSVLIGATVVLQRTTLGAATDHEGRFIIRRIPVGTYTVVISMIGFHKKVLEKVEIRDGDTTFLSIGLIPSLVQAEAVVVTASKREQSLEEVPVSMSIVDAKMLEQRATITIDHALRYVPGVNMIQTQINIRGSSGYSRGVGSRVLLLVDGMPLLAGDTRETIFEAIPAFQVERIEIVKGAGSALYGSSALGGVVNVLTRPISDRTETRWRIYGGIYDKPAFEAWRWSKKTRFMTGEMFSHTQQFGDLGLIMAASHMTDDGYRENDWIKRMIGYVKAKYILSAFRTLTVASNVMYQKRGDFVWWKNVKDALSADDNQRGYSVTSVRANSSVFFKQFVNNDLFYEVRGTHFLGDWKRDSTFRPDVNSSRSNVVQLETQFNYTASETHQLTVGLSGNGDQVASNLFGRHVGFGAAAYVQDEIILGPRFTTTLGIRFDLQKVDTLPLSQQLNPKLACLYRLDEAMTLRGSIGRGFRAPSIGEFFVSTSASGIRIVPNAAIKPEQSWTYEIGMGYSFGPAGSLDIALFRSNFHDLIEASFDTTFAISFQNITRARVVGGEISSQFFFFDRALSLGFHYMYLDPFDEGEKEVLRFRSRHLGSVNLSCEYSFVTFGTDFRYVSRIERIDENLVRLAPIHDGEVRVPIYLLDARVNVNLFTLGIPMRVGFNVNNLLGYNYVELIGNVAPLRHFVLSVEGLF